MPQGVCGECRQPQGTAAAQLWLCRPVGAEGRGSGDTGQFPPRHLDNCASEVPSLPTARLWGPG